MKINSWWIESCVAEAGITFSWSRHSVSACVYLVRRNLIISVYWGDWS